MHRRSLSAVIGLVIAFLAMAAAPAWAGPGASNRCINPTTCLTVAPLNNETIAARGAATELDYLITATGDSDIASATLIVHNDAHLVADPGSVLLGGVTAPAGSVTTTPDGLSINMAAVMPLAARTDVNVSLNATPDNTVDTDMTSWAEVRFDDAGHHGPATSRSGDQTFRLERPALSLQSGSNGPVHVPRGLSGSQIPGFGDYLFLDALNNGAAIDGATLTLEFPSGFGLGVRGVYTDHRLACTRAATRTWTCPLRSDLEGAPIGVDVAADSSTAAGTTAQLHASVAPNGITDADPGDDSVDIDLVSAGIADLSITLTPSRPKLAVGQSVVLTARISNDGPDPATGVVGFLRQNGAKEGDLRVRDLTASNGTPTTSEWTAAASLAPGASVTHKWRVTAIHAGVSASFAVELGASSYDTHVKCTAYGCATIGSATISVVGAAASGPGHGSTGSGSESKPDGSGSGGSGSGNSGHSDTSLPSSTLASTGTPTLTLVLVAVGLLLGGFALVLVAGRRRAGR